MVIVEKRYQEFSSSVQDHSLFGMITMSPANKDYNEAPLTMEVDTRLAFFMIDVFWAESGQSMIYPGTLRILRRLFYSMS